MDTTAQDESVSEDRGVYAGGALLLTMIGLGWMIIGLSALGPIPIALLALPLAVFALLLGGVHALRRAGRGRQAPPSYPETDRAIGQATAWEAAAIVVVVAACGLLHRPTWITPLIAVAVGLHFFPLARALNRPLYYVTGSALCAVGLGVPMVVPPTLGAHHISGWLLGAGIGGGAVIWLTALALLTYGQARTRRASRAL